MTEMKIFTINGRKQAFEAWGTFWVKNQVEECKTKLKELGFNVRTTNDGYRWTVWRYIPFLTELHQIYDISSKYASGFFSGEKNMKVTLTEISKTIGNMLFNQYYEKTTWE